MHISFSIILRLYRSRISLNTLLTNALQRFLISQHICCSHLLICLTLSASNVTHLLWCCCHFWSEIIKVFELSFWMRRLSISLTLLFSFSTDWSSIFIFLSKYYYFWFLNSSLTVMLSYLFDKIKRFQVVKLFGWQTPIMKFRISNLKKVHVCPFLQVAWWICCSIVFQVHQKWWTNLHSTCSCSLFIIPYDSTPSHIPYWWWFKKWWNFIVDELHHGNMMLCITNSNSFGIYHAIQML